MAENAYTFDVEENSGTGVKTVVTRGFGNEIDRRDNASDTSKSFTALMAEALPKIQADIDNFGIGE
jgi:hypothetical protein